MKLSYNFLRAGIILMGFKLNLVILLSNGIKSLEAAVILVTIMLILNYFVARFLKVEHTLELPMINLGLWQVLVFMKLHMP